MKRRENPLASHLLVIPRPRSGGYLEWLALWILCQNLRTLVQEIRVTSVFPVAIHKRAGVQNHLQSELPGQLQENHQVFAVVRDSHEVKITRNRLVQIPGDTGGDYPESRLSDSLKTDGPVPFVHPEIVHLS